MLGTPIWSDMWVPGPRMKNPSAIPDKGTARSTRQRQQLVSGKVKGEKFPLAAEHVVVEFKLQRAKGCKISKLWLKKKMKEKIAVRYEKEEAEKF